MVLSCFNNMASKSSGISQKVLLNIPTNCVTHAFYLVYWPFHWPFQSSAVARCFKYRYIFVILYLPSLYCISLINLLLTISNTHAHELQALAIISDLSYLTANWRLLK